jgi:hypothetical protein
MTDYGPLSQYLIWEALRQAGHERLVRQAERARTSGRWYAGLLAALGAWLADRGSELQARFGRPTPKPTIRLGEAAGETAAP